jgi:hypothetical protein
VDTTAWLERVRQTGVLPSTAENWDNTAILAQGTEDLRTRFAEEIVNTQSGYWRHQLVFSTTTGQNEYRIPQRAVAQGLQKFEVSRDNGQTWSLMKIVTLGSDGLYEGTQTGTPEHYTHYSDYVRVFPTPANSTTKFRFTFYLSPSALIATVASGTVVSTPNSTTIRVSGDPAAYLPNTGGTLDVVHTTGCCEVVLFDVAYSAIAAAGGGNYDITISDGTSLSKVTVGQVVRAVDTTDQIPLIRELHNTSASYTAAMILLNTGDSQQAEKLAGKAGADIKRILDIAQPRDKAHPQKIKPRNSPLRRNASRRR